MKNPLNKLRVDKHKINLLDGRHNNHSINRMVNQMTLEPPEKLDSIFAALSSATRRGILEAVVRTESNATALAKLFNISSPAISKHLKVLQSAGLVVLEREGRNRKVSVNINHLNKATEWINSYTEFWHEEISSLEKFLDTEEAKDAPDSLIL